MSVLNKIERIKRMHRMISYQSTGSPQQFARKMDISQSMLYILIKELKELGAPVVYCRYRESYEYLYPVEFQMGFVSPSMSEAELTETYGGAMIQPICFLMRA